MGPVFIMRIDYCPSCCNDFSFIHEFPYKVSCFSNLSWIGGYVDTGQY